MAGEDRAYLAWVRQRRCCATWSKPGHEAECTMVAMMGVIQAHHTRKFGMGMRSHDHEAVPLCAKHHSDWHLHMGPFRDWDRDTRREWEAEAVTATRDAWVVEQEME